jgi:uncharacterized membrane protein
MNMQVSSGFTIFAGIALLISIVTTIFWMVVGWRAMRAHERMSEDLQVAMRAHERMADDLRVLLSRSHDPTKR